MQPRARVSINECAKHPHFYCHLPASHGFYSHQLNFPLNHSFQIQNTELLERQLCTADGYIAKNHARDEERPDARGTPAWPRFDPAGSLGGPEGEREKPRSKAPKSQPDSAPLGPARLDSEKLLKARKSGGHSPGSQQPPESGKVERQEGERGSNSQRSPKRLALGVLGQAEAGAWLDTLRTPPKNSGPQWDPGQRQRSTFL